MFARIATLVAKDLRVSSRDKLSLYILISPVLLALLMVAVLPLFENPRPNFVVTDGLAASDRAALERVGEVELVASRDAVVARVMGRDDATGIVAGGDASGEIELIVEGDEPEALRGLALGVLEALRSGTNDGRPAAASDEHGGVDLRAAAAALLAFSVPALISLMLGFTVLEEKSTGAIRAYAVGPLRFVEYLVAKLGLLVLLSTILVVPAVGIVVGFGRVDWLALELMVLAGTPFAASYGLLIGAFAQEQLGAIAMIKSLSPPWTSLPILGFVLPAGWLWTQAPFANHWTVQGIYQVLTGGDAVGRWGLFALLTGAPVMVGAIVAMARKLGFRSRGRAS